MTAPKMRPSGGSEGLTRNAGISRRLRPGCWADRLAEAVDCLLEQDSDFTRDAARRLADEYRVSISRPWRYRAMGVLVSGKAPS